MINRLEASEGFTIIRKESPEEKKMSARMNLILILLSFSLELHLCLLRFVMEQKNKYWKQNSLAYAAGTNQIIYNNDK